MKEEGANNIATLINSNQKSDGANRFRNGDIHRKINEHLQVDR